MRFQRFNQVIERAAQGPAVTISIASAHDPIVLQAVKHGVEHNIVEPIYTGNKREIMTIASRIGLMIQEHQVIDTNTDDDSAYIAARLATTGQAQIIMKGAINSTPFLKGVLRPELQLRTSRLLSHLAAFEIPGFDHLFYMTDGGMNIAPDVVQKEHILKNAIDFLHSIGMPTPKIGLLSANERVSEKMPVTLDYELLVKKARLGVFGSVKMDGPVPLDIAISREALLHKGLTSETEGDVDLVLVPTIEAGNILGKAITYFARGTMAGIVLGAKVPLVLNSRADSAEAKLASLGLAALACREEMVLSGT